MLKYLGIAVCTLFCAVLIKDKNRPVAAALSVAGACALLFGAVGEMREIRQAVSDLTRTMPSGDTYIRLMLKVLCMTLLTQFVADICRDNGEGALATVTETAAKLIVITLVLPLFKTVITLVGGLIK